MEEPRTPVHDWVFFPSKPRSGCLHLDCKGPNHSGLVPVRRHRSDARCVLFIQVELLFLFMALCQGIRLESSRLTNSMTSNGSKAHYLSTRPYWNGLPMQHCFAPCCYCMRQCQRRVAQVSEIGSRNHSGSRKAHTTTSDASRKRRATARSGRRFRVLIDSNQPRRFRKTRVCVMSTS